MTALRLTLGVPLLLAMFFAMLIGAATWPLIVSGAWEWYDAVRPVATAEVHRVFRDSDGNLRVDLTITKHRPCDRTSVFGYVHRPSARMDRTDLDRPDGPVGVGHLRPGEAIRSTWRLVDSAQAIGFSVRVEFDCAGRTVVARLVELPPAKLREFLR